jgi:hypothetical protein
VALAARACSQGFDDALHSVLDMQLGLSHTTMAVLQFDDATACAIAISMSWIAVEM